MELVEEKLKQEIKINSEFLYSFDIFDTLITRTVATPVGIFALIRDKLASSAYVSYPQNLRRDFWQVRTNAEKYMRAVSFSERQTRLYFIARDGYILKEIADILIQKYNLPISTKYIYGSRAAWIAPSVAENDEDYGELLEAIFCNLYEISSKTMDMDESELLEIFGTDIINKNQCFALVNSKK